MIDSLYRGDTWELEFQILDHNGNPIDISDYEIRAEIKNDKHSIKKANAKVSGGSDNEIKVLDTQGNLRIIVTKEETSNLEAGTYNIEIEITSPNGVRTTVLKDIINVKEDIITWESK